MPEMRAAAARANVTPPVGITHAHWGAQTHTRAEGVDLDLYATVLVLANGDTQVAIVDVDVIGIPDELVGPIREAVTDLTGIPAGHIRLSASHTHSAGNLEPGFFPEGGEMIGPYVEGLPHRIAGAVWEARRGLRPARIAAGAGRSAVGVNRRLWHEEQRRVVLGRNRQGFVDHDLLVARIDDDAEQPIATIVCYGCHPTIMAHGNALVTPDFPGVLRRTVEAQIGGACLFLQGAAGNVHPKETYSSRREEYRKVGQLLGLEASAVALGLEPLPRVERLHYVLESGAQLGIYADEPGPEPDATLRVANHVVELPLKQLPTLEEAEAAYARASSDLEASRAGDDTAEFRRRSMVARRAHMRLEALRALPSREVFPLNLQAFRVGSLAMLAFPGEPFAELGAEIRRRSPFHVTMVSGYSNGTFGYIPTRDAYPLGGYGVDDSLIAPGGAEVLVEGALDVLKKLA